MFTSLSTPQRGELRRGRNSKSCIIRSPLSVLTYRKDGVCLSILGRCFESFRLVVLMLTFTLLTDDLEFATGDEPKRLTHSSRLKFSPFFRDNGNEVVFVELTDPSLYRIQKLVISDGKCTHLHPDATTSEFEPIGSPDGESYAYLKTQGVLSVGIATRDRQGRDIGWIAPESGLFGFRSPTLAPGSTQIAFAFPEKRTQQIVTSKLNGTERLFLTNSVGLNNWPNYSPDGKSIAFGSSRDGNFEIYVMDSDGNNVRRLTNHPFQDIRPRFSPDGKRIAFTSHRDGNAETYVMNSDGSQLVRITSHVERDDYPEWHPDGRQLITVSEREGNFDLYLWSVPSSKAE
ncbi:MAG: hypothetical protein FJ267_05005 [Planctomycetes bacterium]|nr:hypothetical protein [Planctomycetota bacterium]